MNLTWNDLVQREPRLADLRRRVEQIIDDGRDESFCASLYWYGAAYREGFKGELIRLVGSCRGDDEEDDDPDADAVDGLTFINAATVRPRGLSDPVLGSSEAYDVAYHTLYDLLPDCRGRCRCVTLLDAFAGWRVVHLDRQVRP
jgi:hypothetical protein